MPQDSSKSVVYRSFFSCDDPKGVAESKTSRKSKSVLQKTDDGMVNVQRKQKNLDMSFSRDQDRMDIVSKGPTDDLENSSSVQLMEVSREAHKLNQVIDTWSKGLSFDSHIAKDLLKGALDLQESLTMLGKLQEASKYMAKLKKKHKEKANNDGGMFEGGAGGIERSVSDRFGYRDNKMDFQKPRLSADGSSRDCYEDLREVIRESFAKQNLLPKGSAEEKGCFSGRKSYSEERACSDRTKSSYNEEKTYFERLKSDMSLDYPSTSSSHSSTFHSHEFDSFDSSLSRSQEQKPRGPNVIAKLMGLEEIPSKPWQSNTEKGKQLNRVKPIFDVDLPKARKPSCSFQKVDTQRRTLEELIETVEFQGLVSNKSIDGSKHHRRGHFDDDAPPIVIMKPLNFSISFEEEFQKQKYMREDLYRKDIIRKWKMEKAVQPKRVHDGKGALDLSEIQRRLQAEMSPLKRLGKDKREKDFGDVLKKSEETRIKASAPVKAKMQKKEAVENKVDKNQRIASAGKRDSIEVDSAKSKNASKKPEREQNFSRTRVSQQKGTSSSSTSEYGKLNASHTPNIRRKKIAKNEKETSTLVSTLKVERQWRNGDTQIEPMCEDKHEVTVTKITSPEQRPFEVKSSLDLENGKSSESQLCDSTKMIIHDKSVLESNNMSYISAVKMIICKRDDISRDLLLGNSSFLNQAEELFHFNAYHQHIMPQTTNLRDDDTKLLLDCAKELLEYKSLQCTLAAHPLTHTTLERSKLIISVEHLVDEICKGIEDLQSYHKLSAESLSADTLSTVLQKDLWCRGVVSGSWDLGWKYGFSLDDIEQVILETEQTVFSGIIEDVLADLQVSSL